VFARFVRWGPITAAGLLASGLGAPAFAQDVEQPDTGLGYALTQPLRDLNLMRPQTAEILNRATAAPYDTAGLSSCASLTAAIEALAVVLGPDLDQPQQTGPSAARQIASGAVSSAVALPFSGIVRHLTGAYSEDMAHRRAILSGMVRRSYLSGIRHAMKCDDATPAAAAAAQAGNPSNLTTPVLDKDGAIQTNSEPLPVAGVSTFPETKNASG